MGWLQKTATTFWSAITRLSLLILIAASPLPSNVTFHDYASQFDAFESRTSAMPETARVAAFRAEFEQTAPGLYVDKDDARLNRRIAKALAEFPTIRPVYRSVVEKFPSDLEESIKAFRHSFPDFTPPMPIILAHELGMRDGGSDYVAGYKTMLFGADLIAKIHNDDSLRPFMEHELFHLEHARFFADCDQLWCPLWQEGLATYAASIMTPGASDHQLMLDQPRSIRAPTDAHWTEALCWLAGHFNSTSASDIDRAFTAGTANAPFPPRFGYYVGLRIAVEAGLTSDLSALSRLNDDHARPVVAKALTKLIAQAKAQCQAPATNGPITHHAPRSA